MPYNYGGAVTPAGTGKQRQQNAAKLAQMGFSNIGGASQSGPQYSGTNAGVEALRRQGFQVDTPGYGSQQTARPVGPTPDQARQQAAQMRQNQDNAFAQQRQATAAQMRKTLEQMKARNDPRAARYEEALNGLTGGGNTPPRDDVVTTPGFRDEDGDERPDRTIVYYPGRAQPMQPPSQGMPYGAHPYQPAAGAESPGSVRYQRVEEVRSESGVSRQEQQDAAKNFIRELEQTNPNYWSEEQWGDYRQATRDRGISHSPSYQRGPDGRILYHSGGQIRSEPREVRPESRRDEYGRWIDAGQGMSPSQGMLYGGQPDSSPRPFDSRYGLGDQWEAYGSPKSAPRPSQGTPNQGPSQDFGAYSPQQPNQFGFPGWGFPPMPPALQQYAPPSMYSPMFGTGNPSMYQMPGMTFGGGMLSGQGPLQQLYNQSMNAWTMPKQQLLQWGQGLPMGPGQQQSSPYSLNVSGQFGNNLGDMWNNIGGFIQGVNQQAMQKPVGVYQGQGNPGQQFGRVNYNVPSLIQQGQQMVQGGWQNPFGLR